MSEELIMSEKLMFTSFLPRLPEPGGCDTPLSTLPNDDAGEAGLLTGLVFEYEFEKLIQSVNGWGWARAGDAEAGLAPAPSITWLQPGSMGGNSPGDEAEET